MRNSEDSNSFDLTQRDNLMIAVKSTNGTWLLTPAVVEETI